MPVRGKQDGRDQGRRTRTRALPRWRTTSAQAATIPPPRRKRVTVEVGAGRLRLEAAPPGTAGAPPALSRSLALRTKSSARQARARELRAHSLAVLGRARAARAAAAAQATRSQALRDASAGRLDPQLLTVSALARLKARLATMPVIEQAKGILIAQSGCGPDEAFQRLRRASQRTNVPVRALAALLVEQSIDQFPNRRPRREIWPNSALARLPARPESMPVIEQAKGILMAQHGCGPDEAFEVLCRESQRANVKVSDLAAQIAGQITSKPG